MIPTKRKISRKQLDEQLKSPINATRLLEYLNTLYATPFFDPQTDLTLQDIVNFHAQLLAENETGFVNPPKKQKQVRSESRRRPKLPKGVVRPKPRHVNGISSLLEACEMVRGNETLSDQDYQTSLKTEPIEAKAPRSEDSKHSAILANPIPADSLPAPPGLPPSAANPPAEPTADSPTPPRRKYRAFPNQALPDLASFQWRVCSRKQIANTQNDPHPLVYLRRGGAPDGATQRNRLLYAVPNVIMTRKVKAQIDRIAFRISGATDETDVSFSLFRGGYKLNINDIITQLKITTKRETILACEFILYFPSRPIVCPLLIGWEEWQRANKLANANVPPQGTATVVQKVVV